MPAASGPYDANGSHNALTGMLAALRGTLGRGVKLTPVQSGFLQHFGAIDKAAREGGQLPDAGRAQPGLQTDHPHLPVLVCSGTG
ncbi:hypothetical protein AB0I84_20850 [Streptomyces spectabilis]|uniref:hypothetical protein n=1 Tax=Streptomyces spectabilis TaxID=68270 RepID=UPI0033D8B20A